MNSTVRTSRPSVPSPPHVPTSLRSMWLPRSLSRVVFSLALQSRRDRFLLAVRRPLWSVPMLLSLLGCWGGVAALPSLAGAQAPVREGRLEIGASVGVAGSHALGTENATEIGNGVPNGSSMTLFQAASSFDRGTMFEARVGWHLTRALTIEGTFGVARTTLRTSISNDVEQAAALVATSPLTQYTVEAGAAWQVFGRGRIRPFVEGGGGYLRHLHAGATLAETGQSAYAGGGIKVPLREARRGRPSTLKTVGLRADVRANFTHGGFDISETGWRTYPSLTGGVFVCF